MGCIRLAVDDSRAEHSPLAALASSVAEISGPFRAFPGRLVIWEAGTRGSQASGGVWRKLRVNSKSDDAVEVP
jgi:hypothetical protein